MKMQILKGTVSLISKYKIVTVKYSWTSAPFSCLFLNRFVWLGFTSNISPSSTGPKRSKTQWKRPLYCGINCRNLLGPSWARTISLWHGHLLRVERSRGAICGKKYSDWSRWRVYLKLMNWLNWRLLEWWRWRMLKWWRWLSIIPW